MLLARLCTPALLYLIFSVSQVLIDTFKGMYNTAMIKFLLAFIFTFLLNYLCESGLGVLSWLIIFVPFILMSVIVTMLLFVFNLDPKTGKVRKLNPDNERGNRDVILYHDHGKDNPHDNYNHGVGVRDEHTSANPIDMHRNYKFEMPSDYEKGVEMRHIRNQRLAKY